MCMAARESCLKKGREKRKVAGLNQRSVRVYHTMHAAQGRRAASKLGPSLLPLPAGHRRHDCAEVGVAVARSTCLCKRAGAATSFIRSTQLRAGASGPSKPGSLPPPTRQLTRLYSSFAAAASGSGCATASPSASASLDDAKIEGVGWAWYRALAGSVQRCWAAAPPAAARVPAAPQVLLLMLQRKRGGEIVLNHRGALRDGTAAHSEQVGPSAAPSHPCHLV